MFDEITDPIQLIGAPNSLVRGNYIHNASDGIVAYDSLDHATITDNVIDLVSGRWGIELYADNGSVVSHNTLVYGTGCEYLTIKTVKRCRVFGFYPCASLPSVVC